MSAVLVVVKEWPKRAIPLLSNVANHCSSGLRRGDGKPRKVSILVTLEAGSRLILPADTKLAARFKNNVSGTQKVAQ